MLPMKNALPLLLAAATLGSCATAQQVASDPVEPARTLARPAPTAPAPAGGIVTSADPRASAAGIEILKAGGSATDAAIAVMLMLTVVEPQSSGIGGGGFFVRGDAAGTVTTLDGRETAPAAATEAWFLGDDGEPLGYRAAVLSGLSVGVPGNIRLAAQAHRDHGQVSWERLFRPAIRQAREGFSISVRFREFLERSRARAGATAEGMALFFDADGEPLAVGTRVRNPALAQTLEAIASGGAEAFYDGPLARDIAATTAAATPRPDGMTVQDIGAYRVRQRPPVCGEYRGYRVCGMGPPSSGATTVIGILGILERFDIGAMGADDPTFWHLFAEAQRLVYADRARYLADSDFVPVPVAGLVDRDYLLQRSLLVSPEARLADVDAGVPPGADGTGGIGRGPQESGTSHFAVLDGNGNAVSYTSTIEGPFGSGLMVGGFFLNNELTDFSFAPTSSDGVPVANRVEGSKRPRSSMAPTLVYAPDGSLFMAVGAAGGATIPVQTVRAIIAAIDFDRDAQGTLELPVLYSPGDRAAMEEGTMLDTMAPALKALGHDMSARRLPLKANVILCRSGPASCEGAADPRSEGIAFSF